MPRPFAAFWAIPLAALALVLAVAAPANAQLNLRIGGGGFQPMPIAVADFTGDGNLGPQMSGIVAADLKRSGYFLPLERDRFPETPNFDAAPRFEAWKAAGVQALVTGRATRDASGRIRVDFRLWDVYAGQQSVGQSHTSDAASYRRVAHIIADGVYTKITGLGAWFDSRLAFVDESGPKENRRKRLAIMDQDGANVRYLTGGESAIVSPRYSPATQQVAFMAQATGRQPQVQVINLESGQRQTMGDMAEMSASPRFSPDGRRLVMSLEQSGNSNIYLLDLASRATTRVTNTSAIDTSPSFSPNGREIVFESDRGGKQQIYVMGADGSNPRRISFGEGNNSQPAWSPRGDLIAFTKQKGGSFAIAVMKPDGSGERVLTEGFHNEGPTWAPNGQYVVFFRDPGGQAGGKLYMVDVTGRVEQPVPTPTYASDPTWSPLLTEAR